MVTEVTRKVSGADLELWERFPKHPKILKGLGLDTLPSQAVVVVSKGKIKIILPTENKNSELT